MFNKMRTAHDGVGNVRADGLLAEELVDKCVGADRDVRLLGLGGLLFLLNIFIFNK